MTSIGRQFVAPSRIAAQYHRMRDNNFCLFNKMVGWCIMSPARSRPRSPRSLAFSGPTASPLPLALVGLLVAVFLCIEARRSRPLDTARQTTNLDG